MENETKTDLDVLQTVHPTAETNYIEIINNLKSNTVSKTEYERVLADNKLLAQSLATSPAPSAEEPEPTFTTEDVHKFSQQLGSMKNCSNLQFIDTALKLREAVLATGGKDPFLPNNSDYAENDVDAARVDAIATGLRTMVDYCQGDAQLFNSELKRCCR